MSANDRNLVKTTAALRGTPFPGIDAYQLLKVATEVFLTLHSHVFVNDPALFDAEDVEEYNARHDRRSSVRGLRPALGPITSRK